MAAILAGGCQNSRDATPSDRPSSLTIGVTEGHANDNQPTQREVANGLTLEGLTQVDADGRAYPRLAERWEFENGERRLHVWIRPNIVFHNGERLTSALAVDALREAVRRPDNLSLYPSLADITAVRSAGDLEVIFDLSRRSTWLPQDLEFPLRLGPIAEWKSDADGARLHGSLRVGLTRREGGELNAAGAVDILVSEIRNPGNLLRYSELANVVSIEHEGNVEIVVALSESAPQLGATLTRLLEPFVVPIGTGPYRLVKESHTETSLEAFATFWGGPPHVEHVRLRPFRSLRPAWVSLLRRELDMVTDVPANAIEFMPGDEVQVLAFPRRYQIMVAFNSAKPPFTSATVRRALNMAVDREALIEGVLQGRGTPATGPLWPQHWAYDDAVQPFRFDPESSMQLLNAAGYHSERLAGNSNRPPSRLAFTCLIPAGFAVLERVALEIQKELYDIGVDVQFEALDPEELQRRLDSRQFDAVLLDLISGPTVGRPYIFWRSRREFQGLLNVFGYENSESERLFEVLRTADNEAAIQSATSRLQRVMMDDPPALSLAWNERARAVRDNFQIPNEPGRDPLLSLARWTWTPDTRLAAAQ